MGFGCDFPDFLHANTELRHIAISIQIEFGNHLFRQRAPHAFRDENILAAQLHPRLITVTRRAICVFAKLARDHTGDLSVSAIDQL